MKKIITIIGLLTISFTAGAADIQTTVLTELAKIETQQDYCQIAVSTNKLIQLGDSAVGPLSEALISPKNGLQLKWSAAQVLGEIGSTQGIPALNAALNSDNEWLRDTAKRSISMINHEVPRKGKVYLMSYGVQGSRTDCETGTIELIK